MIFSAIIIFLLLILPFRINDLKDKPTLVIYFLALISREAFTILHIYFIEVPGVGPDYADYHYFGSKIATDDGWYGITMGQHFYEQFLAAFYFVFEPSIFLGFQISIAMFMISFIFFTKLLKKLGFYRFKSFSLVMFSLLPSSILLSSVTMPESGQILFFIISAYYGIKFIETPLYRNMITLTFSVVVLAFFHKGLLPFSLVLVMATIFWRLKLDYVDRKIFKKNIFRIFLLCLLLFTIIMFLVMYKGEKPFGIVEYLLDLGPLGYVEWYRSMAHDTRATYGTILDTSSFISTLTTTLLVLVHYLFEPFVWRIDEAIDLYAFFESMLRLVLLVSAISLWVGAKGENRPKIAYLLFLYFMIAIIWAMGTTNYGTSIRHNYTHNWILFLIGSHGIAQFISQILLRLVRKKQA